MPNENFRGAPDARGAAQLSDAEAIDRVLSGDQAAFEAIMRRYNRLLFRLARGIASNDEDAIDIVQECYVRAYFRLSQFNGPDGFPSWISRIVINEALSHARKRKLTYDNDIGTDDLPTEHEDLPEEIAMGEDTLHMIEHAIDTLPADFRVVFMLRGVEELSVKETAALLNIKAATVKTRFHRARVLLKKALSRRIADTVPASFSFDGERCDSVVHTVFAKISGMDQGIQR